MSLDQKKLADISIPVGTGWLLGACMEARGKLGIINKLVAQVQADAVIHAGDFGFFDNGSFKRLSDRELRLHIVHTDLLRTEQDRIHSLP